MASESRLMRESFWRVQRTRPVRRLNLLSGEIAQRALLLLVLIGILLFLYLAQVSQVAITQFDIEKMEREYIQLQEANRELEREIAELESPAHVLQFARENGYVPVYEADYLSIEPETPAPEDGQTR
nr:septum formation initiator family protein [Ardenticatena sp.]